MKNLVHRVLVGAYFLGLGIWLTFLAWVVAYVLVLVLIGAHLPNPWYALFH